MSEEAVGKVRAEVAAWRHNRGLYPGWVVAPAEVRERVWHHTEHWMPELVRAAQGLGPAERLSAVYELNWRLELTLSPLWEELVGTYTAVLAAVRPFPALADRFPDAPLAFGPDAVGAHDWGRVRREWVSLALAVLRYHREERRGADFERWAGNLEQLPDLPADDRARVCSERALMALGGMDDDGARAALHSWPGDAADPVWAVRRAAVLAELGDVAEARAVAEGCLSRLREAAPQADAGAIPRASREVLASQFVHWLDQGGWFARAARQPSGRPPRPEELDRYRTLGCDPAADREYFETLLERPPPAEDPAVTRRPGYALGSVVRTYHSGKPLGVKLLPAYRFLRYAEEAGVPPRVANLAIATTEFKRAADWFAATDPVRTWTILCRLRNPKLVAEHLPWPRVAALAEATVGDLFQAAVKPVEPALRGAAGYAPGPPNPPVDRAHDTVCTAVALLARVGVRRPPPDFDRLWDLAFMLYSHPVNRVSLTLHEHVENLFVGLIRAGDPPTLAARFGAVLGLPVPGTPQFPANHADLWREGRVIDELLRAGPPPPKSDSGRWPRFAGELLGLFAGDQAWLRDKALNRLLDLYQCGYLTPGEERRLARAYWTPVPPDPEVPRLGTFFRWICLLFPEPSGIDSVGRVRRALLAEELPAVQPGLVNGDALLIEWQNAARRPWEREPNPRRRYVDWTAAEARRMADVITGWWDRDGRARASEPPRPAWWGPTVREELEDRLLGCWEALRFVILPRLRSDATAAGRVVEMVAQAEGAGLPVGAVLPSLLLLDPEADVASRLRHGLVSRDESVRVSAVRGLLHWLGSPAPLAPARRGPRPPPAPDDLRLELGHLCASRRQPGLRHALDAAAAVVAAGGPRADPRFVRAVVTGLDYLRAEAAYRPADDRGAPVPAAEVPDLRKSIARLVTRLLERGHADPVVTGWRDELAADPLPEVRRALGPGPGG